MGLLAIVTCGNVRNAAPVEPLRDQAAVEIGSKLQ